MKSGMNTVFICIYKHNNMNITNVSKFIHTGHIESENNMVFQNNYCWSIYEVVVQKIGDRGPIIEQDNKFIMNHFIVYQFKFSPHTRKNKKYFDISTNNGHEGTNNGMKLYGIPLPTSHQMNKAAKL